MIFVSYSWKGNNPDMKILKLVNELKSLGYDVTCDVFELQKSTAPDLTKMMEKSFTKAEKVIIVLDSDYKKKAESDSGGVVIEYQYLLNDIRDNINKYIFATFEEITTENIDKICPSFLKGRQIIQITYPLENSDLIYKISGVPKYEVTPVNSDKVVPNSIKISTANDENLSDNEETDIPTGFEACVSSTSLFDFRLRQSFPGVRGLQEFTDAKECINRLAVLLRKPLSSKKLIDPIWYFRGNSCLDIEKFERISDTKCLINISECEIDKVAVYINSSDYYRDFVYIQTKPDKPSGVYNIPDDLYNNPFTVSLGYYYEEFGLCGDIPITMAEYDDGAAMINGKLVQSGTGNKRFKQRIRYLTPYNFVICAKFHPFNSDEGDELTQKYLEEILTGKTSVENFASASLLLKKNTREW